MVLAKVWFTLYRQRSITTDSYTFLMDFYADSDTGIEEKKNLIQRRAH